MGLETFDLVLIGISAVMIAATLAFNVVGTLRLGQLSEKLDVLEKTLETKAPGQAAPTTAVPRPGYDPAILPTAEPAPNESKTGLRYRPPGSRTLKMQAAAAGASLPSGPPAPTIPKSGARITPAEPPEAARAPSPEEIFVAGPGVKPGPSAPRADKTPTPVGGETPLSAEPTAEESQALLKGYLGAGSPFLDKPVPPSGTEPPKVGSSPPAEPSYARPEAKTEMITFEGLFSGTDLFKDQPPEEEVLEVIGERLAPAPPGAAAPLEINPFDPSHQKVNFHLLQSLIRQEAEGREFLLDFQDTLFLLDNEWSAFLEIAKQAAAKRIRLSLKNVAVDLKSEIASRSLPVVVL
jgi:hypothetical protein